MLTHITLQLSESTLEHAKQFGKMTYRSVEDVLVDTLEVMWPMFEQIPKQEFYPNIASLNDGEVLHLAESRMDKVQNRRLSRLQSKGKNESLNYAEQFELLALLQFTDSVCYVNQKLLPKRSNAGLGNR